MVNYANLLSFSLLNELNFFTKFIKNNVILIVFNIFTFRTNYTICKNIICFYLYFINIIS